MLRLQEKTGFKAPMCVTNDGGAATFTGGSSRHCFSEWLTQLGTKNSLLGSQSLPLISSPPPPSPPQHSLALFLHPVSSLVSSAFSRAFFFFSRKYPQTGELECESSVSSGNAKNNTQGKKGGVKKKKKKKKGSDDVAQLGNDELGI